MTKIINNRNLYLYKARLYCIDNDIYINIDNSNMKYYARLYDIDNDYKDIDIDKKSIDIDLVIFFGVIFIYSIIIILRNI